MLRHWKPLVTEFALAEALDRSVDEQDHHLVLLCYMRFKDRLSFGWRLQ